MTTQTSIDAFNELCKSKGIKKVDDRVLEAFRSGLIENVVPGQAKIKGMIRTRREAARFLNDEASTVAGAVNRLIRRGKLRTTGGRIKCFVTGNMVESLAVV